MTATTSFLHAFDKKEKLIGVIGLGYVGLPLAVEKAKSGFKTIGFDIQKEKVNFYLLWEQIIVILII